MADSDIRPPVTPAALDTDPDTNSTDESKEAILAWLTEAVAESESFLQSQPGYSQIDASIAAIMGEDDATPLAPGSRLSNTRTNRIAKIAEDMAALLTDTKPFWDYSVANRRFEQHADIYGKLATFWYQQRNVDLVWSDLIKLCVVAGTAYLHIYWDQEIDDLNVIAEDPRNVLPIRPTDNRNLESCLGVIVKKKVPINYIRDRYKLKVSPDSDGSAQTWLGRVRDASAEIVSPIWKWQKSQALRKELPKIPCVTMYTCYLKDNRTNDTGKPKEMGEFETETYYDQIPDPNPAIQELGLSAPVQTVSVKRTRRRPKNNWSYVVQPGDPLFPNRRLIMWAGTHIIYDGPSFYWSGAVCFPVLNLTISPYPWSWLGKAPVWDLLRLQESLNRLLRVVDDHAAQVAQPGAIMDKNSVGRADYNAFDTRRAGWKIYQNPLAGKGIQVVNPPPLDQGIWDQIKWIIEEMKELSGIADLSAMSKLGQMPSASTIESIVNAMTPALRLRSRIMEAFTRQLAMSIAYGFSQFYSLTRRVTVLGPNGATLDDFDFDPGSLVPDFIHEKDYDKQGGITPDAIIRGPLPRWDRCREFLRHLVFKISPASLLSSAQTEQRMIYLQLARAGWMDIFTLWETLGIPNIGVLPDNVRTIPERLAYQQQIGLSGDVSASGRKASGQEIPRLVTKES